MNNEQVFLQARIKTRNYIFDSVAVLLVFFIPPLVHLLKFPVYLFDPMKIIVALALVHTTRKNTYILALTLPLVSFILSDHPLLLKAFLISVELIALVWIFYIFKNKTLNSFFAMFLAIIISKMFYYTLKLILIKTGFLDMDLFSTPFIYQAAVCLILSGYIFIFTDILKARKS